MTSAGTVLEGGHSVVTDTPIARAGLRDKGIGGGLGVGVSHRRAQKRTKLQRYSPLLSSAGRARVVMFNPGAEKLDLDRALAYVDTRGQPAL